MVMAQRHIPVQKHAPIKRLIAVGLAVTLSFLAICGFIISGMADRDYAQVRAASENLVATLAANIGRNFEVLDLSLQAVAEAMALPEFERIDPVIRNMILFDRSATAQDVGSIMVLDRDGNVMVESRALTPRKANYAEREYFKYHQSNADTGAYISRPWVTRPGVHVIGISRRLTDSHGAFSGVAVAVLKISYFHKLLKDIRISDNDNLLVGHTDGTVFLRLPFDVNAIGSHLTGGRIFAELENSPKGWFETNSVSDGVRRLVAYQKVGNWPVQVGVGRSVEEIYAPWRVEALSLGLIVLALCVSNLALVAFLAYSLKRRAAAEQNLAVMATTDVLTGLCNRRRFDEVLDTEWRRAQRNGDSVGLLMIDVDHFKKYNDKFGHQAGDAMLAAIAGCIADNTRRAAEVSARLGGEEFGVLLPGASMGYALEQAERIRAAVLALPAAAADALGVTPTVSIGVAVVRPGTSPAELIKAADKALYEAKAAGRNCTVQAPVTAHKPAIRAA
jgi:diguanylate cyclase (GGDEF)-like protein